MVVLRTAHVTAGEHPNRHANQPLVFGESPHDRLFLELRTKSKKKKTKRKEKSCSSKKNKSIMKAAAPFDRREKTILLYCLSWKRFIFLSLGLAHRRGGLFDPLPRRANGQRRAITRTHTHTHTHTQKKKNERGSELDPSCRTPTPTDGCRVYR